MVCKNCGSTVYEGDIFCQKCGHKVEEEVPDPADTAGDTSEEITAEKTTSAEPIQSEPAVEETTSAEPAPTEPAVEETTSTEPAPSEPAVEETTSTEPVQTENGSEETTAENTFGEEETAASDTAAKAKSIDFKKYMIPAIIAVAVIALIAVRIVLLNTTASKSGAERDLACLTTDGGTVYVINKGKVVGKVSESSGYCVYSMDNSCGVFNTHDAALYYFNSKSVKKIVSDIEYDINNFCLSADGSSVAYLKDGSLYVYTVSNEKNTKIADDVYNYTISPNGSAVLYSCNNDDRETVCYIYCKGETTKIDGKNTAPVAIADNAKYAYYTKANDSYYDRALYVYVKNDSVKLSSNLSDSILFNKDLSEIIYSNDKGCYISIDGNESEKILNKKINSMVSPYYSDSFDYITTTARIYNVDTLKDHIFFTAGEYDSSTYTITYELRYVKNVKNEWSADKIATADDAVVSSDYKSLAYLRNGKLYYIKNVAKNSDEPVELADDIMSFIASDDLGYFYAIDEDEVLQYVDHKQTKRISDDVSSYDYARNTDGYVFFISDDALYSALKNKSKEKISGNECDIADLNGCVFYAEYEDSGDDYDVYANTSGKKFERILKNAADL